MPYLNKVQLIGNLGKDPEIRVSHTTGSKQVIFSLATSRRYRDNNGEQKEDTQWHNIVCWGKVADVVEQLGIRKGTSLYVEGRLANRSWTDQASGQKRYVTEVALDTFQLLTPRQAQNGGGYGAQGQQQRPAYQNEYDQQQADDCEDLPF
jgi:single-strand DNA-binding protein